ncbi:MAG: hypothetical protein ACXACA_06170, partial [Candidatus Ranarchaeia archaeon]
MTKCYLAILKEQRAIYEEHKAKLKNHGIKWINHDDALSRAYISLRRHRVEENLYTALRCFGYWFGFLS